MSPLSRKEIARKMGINRLTVRAHCTQIYEKYGVHSRAELCAGVPTAIGVELTARQAAVLVGLLAGLPLKLIARSLDIGLGTVKSHAGLLYRALGVDGREQLAARYRKKG